MNINEICEIYEPETIKQYITVEYKGTKAGYVITREIDDGGNISEVEQEFNNIPYIEDGNVKKDKNLTVLEDLFKYYNQNYADLDQILYDMEEETTKIIEVEIKAPKYELKTHIILYLTENTAE